MGIISGSVSFRGRFGDHFSVGDHFGVDLGIISVLGIISGSIWGSFQCWGSFRGRDRSGSFRELYIAMTSNPKSLRTTGNEAAKVSVPAF